MADIVAHRSGQDAKHVLRPEDLSGPSRTRTERLRVHLRRPFPWRRVRSQGSDVRVRRGEANVDEERVRRLEDVNGVHIVVVRVGRVVYRSDGKQQAVDLVYA